MYEKKKKMKIKLDLVGARASRRQPVGAAAASRRRPAGPAAPPSQAAWSRGKRRKRSIAMKPRDPDGERKEGKEEVEWKGEAER